MKNVIFLFLLTTNYCHSQFDNVDFNHEFSIDRLSDDSGTLKEKVVAEWIKTDVDRIESIFNKVPRYGTTIDSLIILLPNLLTGKGNATFSRHDMGYELELFEYTLYGGYGSLNFEILHFNNQVLQINQYISNKKYFIENRFLPLIKVPLICGHGEAENQTYYPANIEKYTLKYPEFYLESVKTLDRDKAQEAVIFFSDYSSIRPQLIAPMHVTKDYLHLAFNHIRCLIENKNYIIIETLLYSPMPSGRAFAAGALNYLNEKGNYEPRAQTLSRMDEIQKYGTVLTSGILSCWINKFEYDYYDVYSDFEVLISETN